MLLPIKWLKDYIETDIKARELADKLTLSGSHVESIISIDSQVERVVVGKIVEIKKHPDADKLIICNVDIGDELLQIVTGATNVEVGNYVPVATIGAKLSGGVVIEKTEFRGVDSYGMLCSLQELGYSDSVVPRKIRDGILILDKEYPLGEDILEALQLTEGVIELEITPNRPDCLSMIGMAREASAALNIDLKEPEVTILKDVDHINDYVSKIEVESPMCTRYYAKVIKDVVIDDSPLWMQTRLIEAGMRPVNNIVDIGNFVMLEYGQPLHTFDLEKINQEKIIVRQAKDNEKIITLDGVERNLTTADLVIADGEGPVAIAGVMGSLDSEVKPDTTMILVEGANFVDKGIRTTSKKFDLRSEASNRFEKGIDPNLCRIATNRVCQLVEELGIGTVVKGDIDIYKEEKLEKTIQLRPRRASMLLGIDIDVESMIAYLDSLGLKSTFDGEFINTISPTYRLDLHNEVDLIEEIGRLYGFHNIESTPLVGELTRGIKPYDSPIVDKTKLVLQGLGFNEVMTYSFISPRSYDKINLKDNDPLREYIRLINPLGEDYSVMRTTLIPELLSLMARNYNRGIESSFIYEIGNIFIPKNLPINELPEEKKILSIGFYGEEDFYFLKETINKLLKTLGIKDIEYSRVEDNPTFHPGRTAMIKINGKELGVMGEIHMDVGENFDIDKRVYMAHLDFHMIVEFADLDIRYKALPKYPSMARDLAMVVEEEVLVGDIEKIIEKHGEDLIEKIELFDIYRGDQISKGMKSVAYSIIYRAYDRTLRDEEINSIQKAIIKDLEESLQAKLRS